MSYILWNLLIDVYFWELSQLLHNFFALNENKNVNLRFKKVLGVTKYMHLFFVLLQICKFEFILLKKNARIFLLLVSLPILRTNASYFVKCSEVSAPQQHARFYKSLKLMWKDGLHKQLRLQSIVESIYFQAWMEIQTKGKWMIMFLSSWQLLSKRAELRRLIWTHFFLNRNVFFRGS